MIRRGARTGGARESTPMQGSAAGTLSCALYKQSKARVPLLDLAATSKIIYNWGLHLWNKLAEDWKEYEVQGFIL